MKKILFTLTFLIALSSFGQSRKDSLASNEKVIFTKKTDHHLINKNSKLLILENKDTLILTKRHIPKFVYPEFSSETITKNFKFVYPSVAFGSLNTKRHTKKNFPLRQWNEPIKVFIDKSFPKKSKTDIEKFINIFSNLKIPNLKIELVKKKSVANYYITTTNEEIGVLLDEKKLDQYYGDVVKNRYKDNAKYYLTTDNNEKIYTCVLKVNLETFEKDKNILTKVKMFFFSTLGGFHPLLYNNKKSLLHPKYINNDTISSFDINVLRTHYNYIYPYKVDFNLFKQIEKN